MLAYDTQEDWGEPTLTDEPTFRGPAPGPYPDEARADTLVDSHLWGATRSPNQTIRGLDPDRTLPVAIEVSPTIPT